MSLDVWLSQKLASPIVISHRLFIADESADNGEREITQYEWYNDCPEVPLLRVEPEYRTTETVFERNITHNLNTMAEAAGIYRHLWRPDEIGITTAKELIEPLTTGLSKLTKTPSKFKKYNPSNNWGSYEGLVKFVTEYLAACKEYPDAEIGISR